MSTSRLQELRKEIAELEALERAARRSRHEKAVAAVTAGMSYEEMCEVRDVLNECIRTQYALDCDE